MKRKYKIGDGVNTGTSAGVITNFLTYEEACNHYNAHHMEGLEDSFKDSFWYEVEDICGISPWAEDELEYFTK